MTPISILAWVLFFVIIYSLFTYIKYCHKKAEDESITYKQIFFHSTWILITTIILSILVWLIVYAFIQRDMYAIGSVSVIR
jgi:heme/copper-type cytochrome/quinol oxidase subunit 2